MTFTLLRLGCSDVIPSGLALHWAHILHRRSAEQPLTLLVDHLSGLGQRQRARLVRSGDRVGADEIMDAGYPSHLLFDPRSNPVLAALRDRLGCDAETLVLLGRRCGRLFEKNRTTTGRRSVVVPTDGPWEEEWAV